MPLVAGSFAVIILLLAAYTFVEPIIRLVPNILLLIRSLTQTRDALSRAVHGEAGDESPNLIVDPTNAKKIVACLAGVLSFIAGCVMFGGANGRFVNESFWMEALMIVTPALAIALTLAFFGLMSTITHWLAYRVISMRARLGKSGKGYSNVPEDV